MSKKDLLKQKAKGKLSTGKPAVQSAAPVVVYESELKKITMEIQSDLAEMKDIAEWWKSKKERASELKEAIVTNLIYVRDNKKQLLGKQTFEQYLTADIGISKGYFYEQLQAYNLCLEYKQPELFKDVDSKILVNIARIKDPEKQKEMVKRAPQLTRDDFKKVRPSDFSDASKSHLRLSKNDLTLLLELVQMIERNLEFDEDRRVYYNTQTYEFTETNHDKLKNLKKSLMSFISVPN